MSIDRIGRHEVLLSINYQLIINITFSEDLSKHKKLLKNSENSAFDDFA